MEPTFEFRQIACNLCGSNSSQTLGCRDRLEYRGNHGRYSYSIVRCRECGLLYVNPQPLVRGDKADELYSDSFYSGPADSAANASEVWRKFWDCELARIEQSRPKGSLLEIGSGSGLFLHTAAARGWTVTGLDVSQASADRARASYGVNVLHAELADSHLPPDCFDVAYSHHVLEHALDPMSILRECKRVLKPGGLAVIHVPNETTLLERLANAYVKLRGDQWTAYLRPPVHLFGFGKRTLGSMLAKAGFRVLRVYVSGFLGLSYRPHAHLRPLGRLLPYAVASHVNVASELLGQGVFLTAYGAKN